MNPQQRRLLVVIVLILVVLFLAQSVWGVWQKNRLAQGVRQEAGRELTAVKERRDALSLRVGRLETPRGQEEEIRRNFPVVKVGEKVIIIVNETATSEASSTESWWEKLLAPFK